MSPSRCLTALAAGLLLASPVRAEEAKKPANAPMEVKASGTPGKVVGSRSAKITATVTAIDAAKREITLEAAKGKPRTFQVGSDVRNLDQVKVGDRVVVEFVQGLMMQMQKPGAAPIEPKAAVAAERAEPGEKPAGAMAAAIQATVTITAIDTKNRIVVFEGPEGGLYQVKAGPKVHLDKVKVGDKLDATYTEAVALRVEPAKPAAAAKKVPAAKKSEPAKSTSQ